MKVAKFSNTFYLSKKLKHLHFNARYDMTSFIDGLYEGNIFLLDMELLLDIDNSLNREVEAGKCICKEYVREN